MRDAGIVLIFIGVVILGAPFFLGAMGILPDIPGKGLLEQFLSTFEGMLWIAVGVLAILVGVVLVASED